MKRADLEDLIRQTTTRINQDVLVIGSQAILASFHEERLPERTTLSAEADIAPLSDDSESLIADLIDIGFGDMSPFSQEHGYYAHGVDAGTAFLPSGWMQRLIPIRPDGDDGRTGWCLNAYDVCASKLARGEEKDLDFVGALVDAGMIDAQRLVQLTRKLEMDEPRRGVAVRRAEAFTRT